MKVINIFKKFKLAVFLAAVVAAALMCLVACGKGSATERESEPEQKPQVEVVTGISVDTTNAKLVYEIGGEAFDVSGVALIKQLEDGTSKPGLVTADMVTVPEMSTRGVKTVAVKYGEFTAEYNITVRELEAFELNTDGAKKSFEFGDDFSSGGLVLVASFYDYDGQENISSGYSVIAPDMTTPGMKTVTVSYCGKQKTYDVAVRKAPTLERATIIKVDGAASGVVDVSIEGVLEGYSSADISFDLQKLMSDEYVTENLSVSSSFAPADGRFTLTVQVDRAALESMTDTADVGYLMHIIVNDISYDIVDVEQEVNAQVEHGGKYYRLKGEKCFSDNESKFVILRVASSEELLNPKMFAVNSVKIEKRENKLGLVISGDVSGLNLDNLIIQLREKENWDNTIELETTAAIEGETFTAFAVIPDGDTRIHSNSVMFTRLLIPGYIDENDANADKELHDLSSVTTATVEFGVGSYTLKQESLYDAKQLVTVLYKSAEVEYEVTSVTLEKEGGRIYYVIGGTFDGSTESWTPSIDMQRTYGMWDRISMTSEASVTFGDGTFTVKQDITDVEFDVDQEEGKPCISHIFIRGQQGDLKDVDGFIATTVDLEKDGTTYTYSVSAENVFPDGVYYICFRVTTAQA